MRLAISLALLLALPCAAHAQAEAEPASETEAPSETASELEARSEIASETEPSETTTEIEAASETAANDAANGAASETEPLTLDPTGVWPPDRPRPPVYEEWWFWTAIGVITLGVTLAIVIGVTTEHPETVRTDLVRAGPTPPSAGLVLSFD